MRSRVDRPARALLAASLLFGLVQLARPALAEESADPVGAAAQREADASEAPGGAIPLDPPAPLPDLILDAAVLRPFRAVKVLLGFGIFLAALPMYTVAWDVPNGFAFLVGDPFEDAFLLPLGRL